MSSLRRVAVAVAAAGAALAVACVPTTAAASPAPTHAQFRTHGSGTVPAHGLSLRSWACDAGYVCLYEHPSGNDGRCQYTRSQHNLLTGTWRCRYAPSIGSAYNRRGLTVSLYSEIGCRGTRLATLRPNQKASDIKGPVRSIKVGNTGC